MNHLLKELNQRPIAYFPLYRKLTGSLAGGVLLSQLMYWFSIKDKIYKTNSDFGGEMQLSPHEMKSAKKKLKQLPFIKITIESVPARTYYEIDWQVYSEYINEFLENESQNGSNDGSSGTRTGGSQLGEIHPTRTVKSNQLLHKLQHDNTEFTKVNSDRRSHRNKTLDLTSDSGSEKQRCMLDPNESRPAQKRNKSEPKELRQSKNKKKLTNSKKVIKKPSVVKWARKETIEILEYWNSFDSLPTHRIHRKRKVSALYRQTKTVQKLNTIIYRVMHGTFYAKKEGIPVGLKNKKWSVADIKKIIERTALAYTPEYFNGKNVPGMSEFFFNVYCAIEEKNGINKYRYAFPFLHFANNKPEKLINAPTKVKTNHPTIVQGMITKMKMYKYSTKEYNQIAKQVDKAVLVLKRVSNGNLIEHKSRLSTMLCDTMKENKLDVNVSNLPLGVYNLESFMKARRII